MKKQKNSAIINLEKQKRRGKMYIFDLTNVLTLILVVAVYILLIFLGQELKKSYIAFIPLLISLIILLMHGAQILTLQEEFRDLLPKLFNCLALGHLIYFFLSSYTLTPTEKFLLINYVS